MCRPLWAAVVGGEKAFTILGEGSHDKIGCVVEYKSLPDDSAGDRRYLVRFAGQQDVACWPKSRIQPAFPFECNWKESRKAQWQPNTDYFYGFDDMPTKRDFETAQDRFDLECGTWEKMRAWILAAAELYGQAQCPYPSLLAEEPLWMAARLILRPFGRVLHPASNIPRLKRLAPGEQSSEEMAAVGSAWFDTWAERFSERKNRIPLWAN